MIQGNTVNGTKVFLIEAIMVMFTSGVIKYSCITSWPCPDFRLLLSTDYKSLLFYIFIDVKYEHIATLMAENVWMHKPQQQTLLTVSFWKIIFIE